MPSKTVLAVGVAALLLLSGCIAVTDAITGVATDAITDQAAEMYENASDYTADVTVEVAEDGETTTYEGTVYARPGGNAHRVEFADRGAVSGVVCIQGGEETTVYDENGSVTERRSGSCFERDLPRYVVMAAAFDDAYDAELTGSEEFGTRTANVVELAADADAPTGDVTVWLGAESFVPIQREVTLATEDGEKTVTVTYGDREPTNVSDSRFDGA